MNDLISRQDAIDAIQCDWCKDPIKNIPSAQQWIPCSERMPEKFGDYLVSVKRHGWNCEEHIENDIAYWDDLEGFHKAEEVLAWMPLPEPFKDKHED